jgi:hypothetical protein
VSHQKGPRKFQHRPQRNPISIQSPPHCPPCRVSRANGYPTELEMVTRHSRTFCGYSPLRPPPRIWAKRPKERVGGLHKSTSNTDCSGGIRGF